MYLSDDTLSGLLYRLWCGPGLVNVPGRVVLQYWQVPPRYAILIIMFMLILMSVIMMISTEAFHLSPAVTCTVWVKTDRSQPVILVTISDFD